MQLDSAYFYFRNRSKHLQNVVFNCLLLAFVVKFLTFIVNFIHFLIHVVIVFLHYELNVMKSHFSVLFEHVLKHSGDLCHCLDLYGGLFRLLDKGVFFMKLFWALLLFSDQNCIRTFGKVFIGRRNRGNFSGLSSNMGFTLFIRLLDI